MPSPTPCKHTVSDLFHSPPGVLFTFPSRYSFTIDLEEYLALPVSSGRFPRAIHVSRYSRTETKEIYDFRLRAHYPLGGFFPKASSNHKLCNSSHNELCRSSLTTPSNNPTTGLASCGEIVTEFGLIPFRSPLLRKFLLVSTPPGTEMFYFPGCALYLNW